MANRVHRLKDVDHEDRILRTFILFVQTADATLDIPEFEVILIEEPTPTGPFGAKSVGESGTIAIAPAIYNAIYDAVGVRVKDMPVAPEKIIEGLLALVDQNTG